MTIIDRMILIHRLWYFKPDLWYFKPDLHLFETWSTNIDESELLQAGGIEDAEMRRTFNMGIGMVLVVTYEASQRIIAESRSDDPAYLIGEVVKGEGVQFTWDAPPKTP